MSWVQVSKESVKGSLQIFIGTLLSAVLSAAATIYIARLLGPDGYGVYTLALVIPSVFLQLVGLGVNTAVTRYVAFHLSRGEITRAAQMARRATALQLLVGLALALIDYYAAPYAGSVILRREALVPYIQLASVFVVAQAAVQSANSAFVGWSMMGKIALFDTLQAALKLAIAPSLILLGFGIYGAMLGHIGSYAVQGGLALVVLYSLKFRSSSKSIVSFADDVRTMVRYGLPVFAGGILSGLASQYLTIILAAIATNTVVGYFQAAVNVTVAITVITTAVTTVLFRSFAALDGLKENMGEAFDYAVRYASYLITPVVFFLLASATVMIEVFYGPFYSEGVFLLKLIAVSYLPSAFGLQVLAPFLNGIGRSRSTMLLNIAGATSLVILGPLLGAGLGLGPAGIIYAILVSNVVATALGIALVLRRVRASLTVSPILGIIASSLAGFVVVSLIPADFTPHPVLFLVEAAAFAFVYLSCVPIFGGLRSDDMHRLEVSIEGLGVLGTVLRLVLSYERWILLKTRER